MRPADYNTHREVWRFMRDYQERTGEPPKLREIREAHAALGYRSSVRHVLYLLTVMGMVETVKPEGHARRYQAIPRRDNGREGHPSKDIPKSS